MNNDQVKIGIYFLNKKGEFIKFPLISNIYINYNIKKEDVYVKITKLLTNNIIINNENEYIVYETNVTNIPSSNSEYFPLEIEYKKENIPLFCYLKKEDKSEQQRKYKAIKIMFFKISDNLSNFSKFFKFY